MTYTVMLQFPPTAAMVPPVKRINFVPGTAVRVPPEQEVTGAGELRMTRSSGRISLIEIPERGVSFGAVIVILKREEPPALIVVCRNDFATVAGVPMV